MQLSNVVSSLAEQLELCDWNAVWKALTLPATLLQLKILAIVRLRNKQKKMMKFSASKLALSNR